MPDTPSRNLPRQRILRGRDKFRLVRDRGERVAGTGLVLNFLVSASSPRRVAFIIPKGVGPAVERNRIRRHMREIYRHHQSQLQEGLTSVWIVRRGARAASQRWLSDEMLKLYRKAGLIYGC